MYQKNDFVVYKHDVCKVIDIKEDSDAKNTYYVLMPIDDNSLTIQISTENKRGFLKDVISSDDAKKLLERVKEITPIEEINEKNLEVKYKELLKTGNHEDLIKIIKTTYLRNENRVHQRKKISEKDDTFFHLAEKYLYNELSVSLNIPVDKVSDYISKVVNEQ